MGIFNGKLKWEDVAGHIKQESATEISNNVLQWEAARAGYNGKKKQESETARAATVS